MVLVLGLHGCQLADPDTVTDATSETASSAPTSPSPRESPSPAPIAPSPRESRSPAPAPTSPSPRESPAAPSTSPEDGSQPCADADAAEIDDVVGDQLAAFAAGDYAAAHSYATPGFRESFPLERFEAMITADFPIPATARSHAVRDCRVIGGAAAAVVEVTGAGGIQVLRYGLLQLPEGWRIDGAVPLETVELEVV